MKEKKMLSVILVGVACLSAPVAPAGIQAQEKPVVQIPQPGVPQIMTLEGNFVRAAYNNEGYVILGYQLANRSVGEEWMLLEVGMTVRDGMPDYTLTRDAFSLETPDGKTMPLPTVEEYREGEPEALQKREKVQRDSINYFPPSATPGCRIGFFAELDSAGDALGQGRAQRHARLPRPALFPRAGRDHVRPALAEREVREEPGPRAVPDPDEGRGEAAVERTTRTSRSRSRTRSRRRADQPACCDGHVHCDSGSPKGRAYDLQGQQFHRHKEKNDPGKAADPTQAHRDRHALYLAPVAGGADGRDCLCGSDGRLGASQAGCDACGGHGREARAGDSPGDPARPGTSAGRRRRMAQAIPDREWRGGRPLPAAGGELGEPEAHDPVCRRVLYGQAGGQARARHDQGGGRHQGLGQRTAGRLLGPEGHRVELPDARQIANARKSWRRSPRASRRTSG